MKQHSLAAEKNRDAILGALRTLLPPAGSVLEIGSGSGQHAMWYARALPSIQWTPSDRDPAALESIEAWRREAALPNLKRAVELDATSDDWELTGAVHAIVAIEVTHASPWPVTVGVLNGAARWLLPGGRLIFAGPWRIAGREAPPALEELHVSLQRQDARLGLRDLEQATTIAKSRGLARENVIEYPPWCQIVVFKR